LKTNENYKLSFSSFLQCCLKSSPVLLSTTNLKNYFKI
jgi:hypothetical protein